MQLERIAPFLAARGIDVTIITRSHPGTRALERLPGARVHRMFSYGPKALASLLFMLLTLYFAIRYRRRIDVLHVHGVLSPMTAGLGASLLTNTPIVVKILGTDDISRLHQLPFGTQRLVLAQASVDGFIAISSTICALLRELDVPADRRWEIPSGVDLDMYRPLQECDKRDARHQLDLPAAGLIGVYAGRLHPVKNLDLLLMAWQRAGRGRLVIVGDGPSRPALEALARRLQIHTQVSFVGASRSVASYLQAADWFVQPSSMEGLSSAMLEAMACGLPGIVTEVSGANDVVQHEVNALLIPPNDVDALTVALRTLLSSPELRTRLGGAARATIEQTYDCRDVAAQLEACYRQLIQRTAADGALDRVWRAAMRILGRYGPAARRVPPRE